MRSKRRLVELLALVLSAAIWWPVMHWIWRPGDLPEAGQPGKAGEVDEIAVPMARGLESMWSEVVAENADLEDMREVNPEWDFMARTFFILGEANLALRLPDRKAICLDAIDVLMKDTLRLEARHGMEHFLLGYHASNPWIEQPPRSLFVDGEIALCLGARRLVQENADWKREFRKRIGHIVERLNRGPIMCAESYPDECWIFCNAAAMAALRMSEVLDGESHDELRTRWLSKVREHLVDPGTGMLISAFQLDGTPHPAGAEPEGSSIWFAAHMLQVVEPDFAKEQYRLARSQLGKIVMGFGYSREWPGLANPGLMDIDSGVVIPGFGASASASGLALVAAAGFGDGAYYTALRTSLEFGAFPKKNGEDNSLSYLMAGAIGDPVIFYSAVAGPLWEKLAL